MNFTQAQMTIRANEWQPIECAPEWTHVLVCWSEEYGYNGHVCQAILINDEENGYKAWLTSYYRDSAASKFNIALDAPLSIDSDTTRLDMLTEAHQWP